MESFKVLIIEDEDDIRDLVALHLKRLGHEVFAVTNETEARSVLSKELPSLIVVDWMLPGASGTEIIRALRAEEGDIRNVPMLMLTAKGEAEDIVEGLSAGADDYLTKPFEIPVLLARVSALLRRASRNTSHSKTQIRLGELEIWIEGHEVKCRGQRVELTPYEFKILMALIDARGTVLTRSGLIEKVQGVGVKVIDRAIDTHVFGLRKKLGECADWIETVRGVGYRVRWHEEE